MQISVCSLFANHGISMEIYIVNYAILKPVNIYSVFCYTISVGKDRFIQSRMLAFLRFNHSRVCRAISNFRLQNVDWGGKIHFVFWRDNPIVLVAIRETTFGAFLWRKINL